MAVTLQQKQAAEQLGVTPRTLRDWHALEGFPDCSAGYNVEAIRRWREEEQRKGSAPSEAAKRLKLALAAEKLKQAQTRTRRDQLELETKEGTLLPRKAVEQSAAVLLSALADWCEQLPDLLAGVCCRKCATKLATRTLTELHQRREQLADDLRSLTPERSP